MSRIQQLKSGTTITMPVAGVPTPLSNVERWVKSVIVQAGVSNSGFIYIGDATNQLHALEPRRSLKIWGDEMDQGGTALINLASIYIQGDTNGDSVTFMFLEGK